MGKVTKEQSAYAQGMEHALRVAQIQGLDALEREVKQRNRKPLPLNVSPAELRAYTRASMGDELMLIATSLAWTVQKDLNFPPSMVLKFLRAFNNNIDTFSNDEDAYKDVQRRLNQDMDLKNLTRKFLKE